MFLLQRKWFTNKSTIGELSISEVFLSFVLEPPRGLFQIPFKTAIPAGIYRLELVWSEKFQQYVLELKDVPYRSHILIHPGNTFPEDTSGCLCPGLTRAENYVGQSRVAYNRVLEIAGPKLMPTNWQKQEKLNIKIEELR